MVVGLTVAGFFGARALGEHDAHGNSVHRADLAAAQIRARVAQGSSLTESLRRFIARGGAGVTSAGFANNASEVLSPAGFPAAAWVEQVPASRRVTYERRVGHPIVTQQQAGRVVRAGSRPSYLPATLVSGITPMAAPGIDLGSESGMRAALTRASRLYDAGATRLATRRDGTKGLFLIRFAPRLNRGIVEPGFVVVFMPELALRAAATAAPELRLTVGGASTRNRPPSGAVRTTFTEAGQRFDLVVPEGSAHGAAAVLPWIILAAGLVLAGLAAALGVNAARRAKAQDELDRIFNLSSDLIVVADFEGRFTRVNPAAERVLGYTQQELLTRPYLEFVHPDDRERTAAEAAVIGEGKTAVSFENRYVREDGSVRVLQWTSTPVVEDKVMYAVARDVTERRQAEAELERLAGEQAALRRVATLVARQASQGEVVTAIAEDIGRLLGAEIFRILRYEDDRAAVVVASSGAGAEFFTVGSRHRLGGQNATSRVFETVRPVRIDDLGSASGPIGEAVRSSDIRSVVGTPIMVEGRLWGAMLAGTTRDEPLPADTEYRLGQFTELMATAIANTESRARADRLAEEQAALRRVATLVAKESAPAEVFAKVAEEVANVLGDIECALFREEGDGTASTVAAWGTTVSAGFPVGTRTPVDGGGVLASVTREGRPCRIDDYSAAGDTMAEGAREHGIGSAVGCPILVRGRIWGAMVVARPEPGSLPPETEARLTQFGDLVATALANAEARAEVERLAEEQAALRRVATLVAQGVRPAEMFSAVSEEVRGLFGSEIAAVARFDPDGPAIVVEGQAHSFEGVTVGPRFELDDSMTATAVYRNGRSARIDGPDWSAVDAPIGEVAGHMGIVSMVSSPIGVEGRLWGVISVAAREPLPAHTEKRLEKFTELVATAIANAESRGALRELADEQAALRRVATLVAQGASPGAVLDAVAAEMERLLGADGVTLSRYEPDEEVIVVAHSGSDPRRVPPGTRVSHRGENVTSLVRRSERSARMEHHESMHGAIAQLTRTAGVRASVGAPIVVDGRLWGVAIANWRGEDSPPADTEERMAQFAELLDTAIANADSRDQLTASRARLLTAADEARRRVVRDLHDGAQQRLVHNIVTLKLAQRALREKDGKAESLIGEALEHAEQGNAELRELAHGILPSVLTRGGFRAGVEAVVARLDLPVQVDVPDARFPAEIEASAYFVVAEALTNVVKYSNATRAEVRASVQEGALNFEVRDDGIGGADPSGHGLVGMSDRVSALGGRLEIESPAGGGTVVAATLPLSGG